MPDPRIILGYTCAVVGGSIVWYGVLRFSYDLLLGRWLRKRRKKIQQRPGFQVIPPKRDKP